MKNVLILCASVVMLSCTKKDWNCKCTVNGDEYQKTITHTTKTKAGTACSDYGKSIGQSFGSYTYVCKVN